MYIFIQGSSMKLTTILIDISEDYWQFHRRSLYIYVSDQQSHPITNLHSTAPISHVLPAAPPSTALLNAFLRILATYVWNYKNDDNDDGDDESDEWNDDKDYSTGPYCMVPMSTFIATATGADDEEDKIILLSTIDTNEENDDDDDDDDGES